MARVKLYIKFKDIQMLFNMDLNIEIKSEDILYSNGWGDIVIRDLRLILNNIANKTKFISILKMLDEVFNDILSEISCEVFESRYMLIENPLGYFEEYLEFIREREKM